MQLSRDEVLAFVEGKNSDPVFYGELCSQECSNRALSYGIRRAHELPTASQGKPALIEFFLLLKHAGVLNHTFGKKTTTCIFFLDKDVDDILGAQIRSPHVVYTQLYDVEAHIISHGQISKALAACLHVTQNELAQCNLVPPDWHLDYAKLWKEWTALCLLKRLNGLSVPGYAISSRVNRPLHSPTDANAFATEVALARLSYTGPDFDDEWARVLRLVDSLLRQGHHLTIFKGRWLITLLSEHADQHVRLKPNRGNLKVGLVPSLLSTLNYSDSWSQHFRKSIQAVLP